MHTLKSSTSEFTDPASQITNHTFSAPITLVYTQRVKGPSTSKPSLVHSLHVALTPDLNPSIQWRQVSSIEVECKSIDTLQKLHVVVTKNFPSIEGKVTSVMKIGGDLGRHQNPLSTAAKSTGEYWQAIFNDGKFGVVYILDPEKEDGLFASGYGVRVRSSELTVEKGGAIKALR